MSEKDQAGRRVIDARLHLLDRQVLDVDGTPVTSIDDLEIVGLDGEDVTPGRTARVAALLTGPALITRLLGGRPPRSRWERIEWRHVDRVGTTVDLSVDGETLDLDWSERWVRDRVIARIPGGRHDPEED